METPEIIFENGDIVKWYRRDIDSGKLDLLLELIGEGLIEPFQVIGVRNYEEEEKIGRGHSQEITIIVVNNIQKVKILPGWWFQKIATKNGLT
jgi:hypothetical protein